MAKDNKNSVGKELSDKLSYVKKPLFESLDEDGVKKVFDYSEGYKQFLDASKTERDAVKTTIAIAQKHGFTEYKLGDKLSVGDKKYLNNRGKSLVLLKIGTEEALSEGVRIIASHIDSPRLDIKQNPLYEDEGMAFLKTHYYGGIKKYQWTAIPLALHGVVSTSDGRNVSVVVGENDDDPIFYVNDLLPHLSKEQNVKPLATAIDGETLNVLVGGLPFKDDEVKEKIKLTVLKKLNESYGMVESDFLSAELCAVPAMKAKDVGFDRSMIAGYGHDDKVCSYPAISAITEMTGDKTVMVVLADKEEIGSCGATGMTSHFYENALAEIMNLTGEYSSLKFRRAMAASNLLSADVSSVFDPMFADSFEQKNVAYLGGGLVFNKVTGSRGKSGANDANAEYLGALRGLLDEREVTYQYAEYGRIDLGGSGTISHILAEYAMNVVDCGTAVMNMHAPYEVTSKVDVYETMRGYRAFLEDFDLCRN